MKARSQYLLWQRYSSMFRITKSGPVSCNNHIITHTILSISYCFTSTCISLWTDIFTIFHLYEKFPRKLSLFVCLTTEPRQSQFLPQFHIPKYFIHNIVFTMYLIQPNRQLLQKNQTKYLFFSWSIKLQNRPSLCLVWFSLLLGGSQLC